MAQALNELVTPVQSLLVEMGFVVGVPEEQELSLAVVGEEGRVVSHV